MLELRQGNIERARAHFNTGCSLAPLQHESWFNGALLTFKLGDFQEAYKMSSKSLQAYPLHTDSQDLIKQLRQLFTAI